MRRVAVLATIIFSLSAFSVNAYTSPGKPQGFVNDFAGILSSESKASLNQNLSDFKNQTTIEISVVTIPSLGDETIEKYAVKLFEEWGIGDKEKDNGVLFLIAPNEKVVRIEVGYGLEGVLTDAQSNGIIQSIVLPEFRNGNLENGILKGSQAIVDVVKSEADYSEIKPTKSKSTILSFLENYGIIIIFILISVLGSTKSWWLGGVLGGVAGIVIGIFLGIVTGIVATIVLILLGLLFDYIVSKHGGRGGGFWGGFGGHGGSGGGFGGFGGGMSGGGGSSGRW